MKNLKGNVMAETTVLEQCTPEILQISLCRLKLSPGEKVKLEIPQREKGLYVFQAVVLETGTKKGSVLQLLDEPQLLQRRKSPRIPAYRKAEYILFVEKKAKRGFHESLLINISRCGALLAVEQPLTLNSELFLLFDIYLHRLLSEPQERLVYTGIKGKVVREHFPLVESLKGWNYSYGVAFRKSFAVLSS